ncbi:MAG: hypothetical protein K5905_03060 [Roseibium sp.]|uniref:hypothetical protein n=1 Tax=Roseibium sp. TaxID=1936156 RepID=UPI002638B6C0|nr:hypothetical protein [Roseibium sp.]MCV0424428.1 hypothetical protein [Roseibium sp.]
MAMLLYEPKDVRKKRAELRKQDLDRDTFMAAYNEDETPEAAIGPIEFFPMTDKEDENHFILNVNRETDDQPAGAISLSVSELIEALSQYLDFERSREMTEAFAQGYKDGTNPSIAYRGSPLDPIDLMEDRRDFSAGVIASFKSMVETLEAELPRYDAWIDNQRKKRKIRKDWPPYKRPRS